MLSTDRILNAAGTLFAEHGVAAVEMQDIARAAGCSRATLYRYFANRNALHTAYVNREARAVGRRIAESTAAVTDQRARLLTGITEALRLVRESPSLAAWFAESAMGTRAAAESGVVAAMTAAFLESLRVGDPEIEAPPDRRARWLVRVLASLLLSPGFDAADETSMIEEFVLPVLLPDGDYRIRVTRCNSQATGMLSAMVTANSAGIDPV